MKDNYNIKNIRNFTIIAHINHGKSTLADRLLEFSGLVVDKEQMLDSMSLERERGMTIKSQTCRFNWTYNNEKYTLNLIDTPGHVDFSYEVDKALESCNMSLFLIDASQGAEAQTVANLKKARKANHKIIPVLNKVDLPQSDINRCLEDLDRLGVDIDDVFQISAKSGAGVKELLNYVCAKGLAPQSESSQTRAFVIDSWYDKYLGVISLIKLIDGTMVTGQKLKACSNGKIFNALNVGIFNPKPFKTNILRAGEIGYVVTHVKNPTEIKIGDTLIDEKDTVSQALPGFKESKPVVFCNFYPDDSEKAAFIHESLKKYILNDSAFTFQVENSDIYGMIFLCGFLGLLHLEIVKERLKREHDVDVLPTIPSVIYKMKLKTGEHLDVYNPNDWPSKEKIDYVEEPMAQCKIFTGAEHVGKLTTLCVNRRAEEIDINTIDDRIVISCRMPLSEIIVDLCDQIQSLSSGFASFEYELSEYQKSDLSRLIILLNGEIIKEFGLITHVSKAKAVANKLAENLAEIIERSQVDIKIQVAENSSSNIIARSDKKAYRKDVIAKCYGGDITRKNKLLDKQKEGKSKMGTMSRHWILKRIPSNAIKQLLKMDI
jgi:GTP-binding protein LepA